MGVDAIITIENSTLITLDEFVSGMAADPWGKRYALTYSGEYAWVSFEWDYKTYFHLAYDKPRYAWLFEEEWHFERGCGYKKYPNTRYIYELHVAFCKAMRWAEKLAGGPVLFGNDVIHDQTPEGLLEIGYTMENWRTLADLDITPEALLKSEED